MKGLRISAAAVDPNHAVIAAPEMTHTDGQHRYGRLACESENSPETESDTFSTWSFASEASGFAVRKQSPVRKAPKLLMTMRVLQWRMEP